MTASIFGAADRAYAFVPTTAKTGAYTAAANQLVPGNTSAGAFTVTLPPAPADLTVVAVKLLVGANPLTVATSSGDTFDSPAASTSQTLTVTGQGIVCQYSAAAAIWYVSSDDLPLAALDARYAQNVDVSWFGALGNGTHDDTSAIQAALNAAPAGGSVFLRPGTYATSVPLTIPPQVALLGTHSSHIDTTACAIKPLGTFAGAAVILLVDQATGGYSIASTQQSVRMLTLDGSALSGSTIDGIQSQGFVHGVILEDVQIRSMPNHAVNMVSNSSGFGYSWRGTRVLANACQGYAYSIGGMTDCTWIDVETIGSGKSGFLLAAGPSNSKFIGCRSEYSNWNGWEFSGSWTGSSSGGGCTLVDCSTDGNNRNGILVTATGDSPLSIIGGSYRRDGANVTSGGGNYAGIQATGSTIPVHITQPIVIPGIAQTGGVNSPEYGFSVNGSSSNITVSGGVLHAATQAWIDDGTNSNIGRGANVLERVGTESSYTSASHGLQASLAAPPTWDAGAGSVYSLVANRLLPEDLGFITATADLDAFSSTVAMASGTLYLAKVVIRRPTTVTNIVAMVTGAGATLTSGQNLAGIYSSTGTLLKATADQSTAWTTTGLKTMALTATITLQPGVYYIGLLSVGTTPPTVVRSALAGGGATGAAALFNLGATASTPRSSTLTGQTSLPTVTLSSTTQQQYVLAAALT